MLLSVGLDSKTIEKDTQANNNLYDSLQHIARTNFQVKNQSKYLGYIYS